MDSFRDTPRRGGPRRGRDRRGVVTPQWLGQMSALRKKIAEKKAAEQKAAAYNLPPVPAEASSRSGDSIASAAASALQERPEAEDDQKGGIRQGWLSKGSLYPEGSSEAAPKMWRDGNAEGRAKVFQLITTDDEYEVRGDFSAAGRYLGKEDFDVTRNGMELRIKGNPNEDPQSLVAGFDESVTLPVDAAHDGMRAEYTKEFVLSIHIPRSSELRELLSQLSVEECQALAARLASAPTNVQTDTLMDSAGDKSCPDQHPAAPSPTEPETIV